MSDKYYRGYVLEVSGDGSVIFGLGSIDVGSEAFVLTEPQGMRRLANVLPDDYGLDPGEWLLQFASGVSDDGLVIVRYGVNPGGNAEGWVVRLPDACFEEG